MKSILIISGSPRPKGNTYKIMQHIQAEMESLGTYTYEWVFLKKVNLGFCKGCLNCMKKGEEHCPCNDDALEIRDKLLAADGIVFLTPVYVHTVSALLKNLYDRFAWCCHRPRLLGKSALLLVTTELSGIDETLAYMAFPANAWGLTIADAVGVVYPTFQSNPQYRAQKEIRLQSAAQSFHTQLHAEKRDFSMPRLAFFHLMKKKVTLHKDVLPYDYQFWRDNSWLEKSFYDETGLPKLKNRIARTLVSFRAGTMLKKAGYTR